MSTEDKPEKPGEEKSAKWHRARAKRLREHGFTKMAEEHEQIARNCGCGHRRNPFVPNTIDEFSAELAAQA
jgi:hypothetical protein